MKNTLSKKDREYSLDTIKMLAAFLVVFQHAIGNGVISGYLLSLSRIAVPLFMMVTGFLYVDVVKRGKEIQQIKRYFIIAVEMTVLYFVLDFGWSLLKGNTVSYLHSVFKPSDLLAFFVWNDPTIADHAWYMWAMTYTLIIVKFVPAIYKNRTIRMLLIVLCIVVSLVFGKYAVVFWGGEMLSRYTRNAWTVGIPFFLIGIILREHKDILRKISEKKAIIVAGIMAALCLVERYLLIYFQVNASRDNYIFMPFFAIMFFIVIYNSEICKRKNILAEWGVEYSLTIYIIHPLFVRVERALIDMSTGWQYVGFIFVLVISLASAFVLNEINKMYFKSRR